jgi:hypothetical protein
LDTKDFLTRVFPPNGDLIISVQVPKAGEPHGIFWNKGSFTDLDEAVAAIHRWDAEPRTTVYYAVGAFAGHRYTDISGKEKYRRQAALATQFKTLALDLDIGTDKPYATKKEGWQVLRIALEVIGLPMPMIISSGNGLHCYWPLTSPIGTAHWVKASTALRLALAEHNVLIDTTKIHDPSMVLRPVGAHHKKQTPHKPVECILDSPDYDPLDLFAVLKPWFRQVVTISPAAPKKIKSSIAAAVLEQADNTLSIALVANNCKQVQALVESGGVTNTSGGYVDEPMWRTSLGLVKYSTDIAGDVVLIAGKHPDFDLDENLKKLENWNGTGPSTCDSFKRLNPKGCEGCPHNVKSPAQLSYTNQSLVELPGMDVPTKLELPRGYIERNGSVFKEVKTKSETTDANGVTAAVENTELDLVSPYLMHITGAFYDHESKRAAFKLLINYPITGWDEQEHEITVLSNTGRDFSAFLLNRQVYIKHQVAQEKIRGFLMDYLTLVQKMSPTGLDFIAFGWQPDGSFLCGEKVIGSPTGNTERRLRGPAGRYVDIIKPHGDRAVWIQGMQLLNKPGTQTIRSAILLATAGILGPVAGNASMVLSIYSTETTTGKSLALIAVNSLIGSPKELFMNKNDTANALFKVRGVLNNLPCTIDELTSANDQDMVNLAYDLSQGREKLAMTKDRELREPVKWDGPTLITTNISLHQKFEMVQANNDPLKARTMELNHFDRSFILSDEAGSSDGYRFFDMMAANNGWAFPELVEHVLEMGGPAAVWARGEKTFLRKFGFIFEPQERYYRTGIIAGWILGSIGKALGLFPFDVDDTINGLLDHVKNFRKETIDNKQDVFDVIGQFLQEHNDRLIEVTEVYGSGVERVHLPAPDRAVARLKLVHDKQTPIMVGSQLAINTTALRQWLGRNKDGVDRIIRELQDNGALIAAKDRVTMFKGCTGHNPGQAHCVIVNIHHPRFLSAVAFTCARLQQSNIALAVLQGGNTVI